MNSKDTDREENGAKVASASTPSSCDSEDDSEGMKRAAVKQLIERYYHQLTDGCGRSDCGNEHCSSSHNFSHRDMSRDRAAIVAIDLFKKKGPLCNDPSKVPKSSDGATEDGGDDSMCDDSPCASTSEAVKALSVSPVDCRDASGPSVPVQCTSQPVVMSLPSQSTSPAKETPFLTEERVYSVIETCRRDNSWSLLIRTIGSIFNNPESLLLSFRKEDSPRVNKEELQSMVVDLDKDTDDMEVCGEAEASLVATTSRLKDNEVTVDVEAVRRVYTRLYEIPKHLFQASLVNAVISLSRSIEMDLKYHGAYDRDPNYLNIFIIVMAIPVLHSPEFIECATPQICKSMALLPIAGQAKLARIWSRFTRGQLKDMVDYLQQLITLKVVSMPWSHMSSVNDNDAITSAARVLKILYYASVVGGCTDPSDVLEEEARQNEAANDNLAELLQGAVGRGEPKEKSTVRQDPLEKELGVKAIDCREPIVSFLDFVNEPLSEAIEMEKDYTYYRAENVDKFSFMTHPFLLTTTVKSLGMYFDNRIRMLQERRTSIFQTLVHGAPTTPYLRLPIRRDHIIDDALVALEMAAMCNPQDLKKQLYVEFDGEQGIDEGGVSKEFFQLVIEEIFNPDIGMFVYSEDTCSFWFNPTSFENDGQFSLIGIVLGLAIYNNVILDIHLPMVIYRKLMGKKGVFADLFDSHPTLARSLQDVLVFEDDVQDTFMQSFQISYRDVFGTNVSHDLKDNGSTIPVTAANRQEFVDLYTDFLLNKSIERQFRAFKRGFQMVMAESPLQMLFRPDEVELLVCGSKNLDFQALEDTTEYDGGFTTESAAIRYFWEICHAFSEEQKRKLLQFTTGSDRIPVGGLAKLKLIIAKNGPDSDRLPTAHTCFNVLLLPDYATKDKLEERLLKAITYAKGFGML